MRSLLTDRVRLLKANGEIMEEIPASVQPPRVFIDDSSLLIEEGDRIERIASNGLRDMYVVEDPGFKETFGGIKAHYQIRVRKEGQPQRDKGSYNVSVSGPNARVNIGSTDNSTNVASGRDLAVFDEIRSTVERELDTDSAASLLVELDALEQMVGSPEFAERYKAFISAAADHMALLAPFLPALTQLL